MPRGPKLALLTLTDEQRDQLNGSLTRPPCPTPWSSEPA